MLYMTKYGLKHMFVYSSLSQMHFTIVNKSIELEKAGDDDDVGGDGEPSLALASIVWSVKSEK